MSILVLAETDAAGIRPATLSAVTAACELGNDIHLLVLGDVNVAETARRITGVSKIISGSGAVFKDLTAEIVTQAVLAIAGDYTTIIAAATTFGKNVLPRIAAKLDIQQVSDVMAIETPTRFVRPIYAGNALQTVETSQAKNVLTIRATSFQPALLDTDPSVPLEARTFEIAPVRSCFMGLEGSSSERPDLTSAKIVVSGGRGVGSKENFRIIEELADDLHAAVGASRAAVDAGYVPNDYQVGQTGKIVAPDLYIAIGISGAIQHLAGMVGSKIVVAINKDADAPIFQIADYGLVGDLFDILPKLRYELKNQ